MTKEKLNMYKVTIYTITNEKLYARDEECDHYDEWSGSRKMLVAAPSIEEALEIAKADAIKRKDKWRSVDHSEETAPRHWRSHIIYNDEYTDKLQELYGR